MTSKNKHTENEYCARINKAFDYIEQNIEKQLSLEELAEVANFSKFHFLRIFQAATGETPFKFIQRLRLEKAASMLIMNPQKSVTEIAYQCGFSDISIFSRNFKTYFKTTPTGFRNQEFKNSNLSQTFSNGRQSDQQSFIYFCYDSQQLKWRTNMELNKSVEVKTLPKMTVAYIRHIGPYKGDEKLFENLWNRLFTWAGPRNLIGGPYFKSLIIYHDDPNMTSDDKLRTSVCIGVPPDTKTTGEVGKMEIEAGKYVIARFEVTSAQFEQAWEWVYGQWLPDSGYQPDDNPCFEMYPEEPKDGKFIVDICVPVKPL